MKSLILYSVPTAILFPGWAGLRHPLAVDAQPLNGSCTFCEDGSPPSPDLDVEFGRCGDLETEALSNPEFRHCNAFLYSGFQCGCANAPPQDGSSCSLCQDGSSPPDPEATPYYFSPCGELETQALWNVYNYGCDYFHYQGALCGCDNTPPEGTLSCPLCQDGTPVPDKDKQVNGRACGVIETDAFYNYYGLPCDSWNYEGFLCGCENDPPSEGGCSLCQDGTPISNPDIVVEGQTCGDLEAQALFNPYGSSCDEFSFYGFMCGCDNSPNPETSCSLCQDGSPVPDEDKMTDSYERCGDLETEALWNRFGLPCKNYQYKGAQCGCANTPPLETSCSLCEDGSPIPDPDKVPFFYGRTCSSLEEEALWNPYGDPCESFLYQGAICGCIDNSPPEGSLSCSLCQDGSSVPDVDKEVNGQTCGEIEAEALFNPYSRQCDDRQFAYSGYLCGCQNEPLKNESCSLCQDGSPIPDEDRLIQYGQRCADLQDEARFNPYSYSCDNFHSNGFLCGCDNTPLSDGNSCSLCQDGSPPPDKNKTINGYENCGDLEVEALWESSGYCDTYPFKGFLCGCDNKPPADAQSCSLCQDGSSVPDKEKEASYGQNCGDLEAEALFNPYSVSCDTFHYQGYLCGCANEPPPDGGCLLCQDGSSVSDKEKMVDGQTCGSLEAEALFNPYSSSCDTFLYRGYLCGCANEPAPDLGCSLCQDGSSVPDPNKVVNGRKCGDLEIEARFNPYSYSCDDEPTLLYNGYLCGCEANDPLLISSKCSLCQDGSPIPDPDKVVDGQRCGNIEGEAHFNPYNNNCDFFIYYGYLCGCSNNEAPENNRCSLCEDGSSVEDPNKMASFYSGQTCGEAEVEALFNPNQLPCEHFFGSGYACGCNNTIPENGCGGLCQDGSDLPDTDLLDSSTFPCRAAEAEALFASYANEYCSEYYGYGSICGCDNVPPNDGCALCPDGSAPPNAHRVVLSIEQFSVTCAMLAEYYQYSLSLSPSTPEGQAQCTLAQAVEGSYCGCDATPEKICPLCLEGEIAEDTMAPNFFTISEYTAFSGDLSCLEVEVAANDGDYGVDMKGCSELRDQVADTCCVVKEPMPAPVPTVVVAVSTPTSAPIEAVNTTAAPVPADAEFPTPPPVERSEALADAPSPIPSNAGISTTSKMRRIETIFTMSFFVMFCMS